MKKMLLLCGIAAVLAALTGCSTTYREAGADYLNRPTGGIVPYYTDFDVTPQRVESSGKATVLFWFFQISEGKQCLVGSDPHLSVWSKFTELFSPTQMAVRNAKGAAIYNACERFNADQILGASFEYKISNYLIFATVECTAKGFPATARGVKIVDRIPVVLNERQRIEYLPYGIGIHLKNCSNDEINVKYNMKKQK